MLERVVTRTLRSARNISWVLGASSLILLPAADLHAQVETEPLEVTFEVTPACVLAVQPLDFGSSPQAATNIPGETTITVTCPDQSAYEIGLSVGESSRGGGVREFVTDDGAYQAYELFQDAGRTQVWGDGGQVGSRKASIGTGSQQSHTVYGQVRLNALAPTGEYQDTVMVSIYL